MGSAHRATGNPRGRPPFAGVTSQVSVPAGAKDSVYYIDDFSVSGPEGKGK